MATFLRKTLNGAKRCRAYLATFEITKRRYVISRFLIVHVCYKEIVYEYIKLITSNVMWYKITFEWAKVSFVMTKFIFVDKIEFCLTKFNFVYANKFINICIPNWQKWLLSWKKWILFTKMIFVLWKISLYINTIYCLYKNEVIIKHVRIKDKYDFVMTDRFWLQKDQVPIVTPLVPYYDWCLGDRYARKIRKQAIHIHRSESLTLSDKFIFKQISIKSLIFF